MKSLATITIATIIALAFPAQAQQSTFTRAAAIRAAP
jgi:hypothetical protein